MKKWRIVYRVENSHPDAHRMMSIGGSLVIAQGLGYAHALKAANLLLGGEFLPGDTLLYKNSVLLELEKHD
jgi:hypothetical protein